MSKFNPSMLVPANIAPEFSKQGGARTAKAVLLANIAKQKHLFLKPDEEGKRTFKVAGETVAFTLRASNTGLVLGQYEANGVKADVKEMTVPKANFIDALDYFKDKIEAGEFDAQIASLDERKAARTDKLRATRASKKTDGKSA